MKLQLFPSMYTTSRLFGTGAILGPLVDGLHNQCLLEYHRAPLNIYYTMNSMEMSDMPLFCTSLWVPPLLGFAYVVLGGVLPRWLSSAATKNNRPASMIMMIRSYNNDDDDDDERTTLRNKAYLAVLSTALLIKMSEILETQSLVSLTTTTTTTTNIGILVCLALLQWAWLDGTFVAFLLATIASIGGPWSELPFVAAHVWEYLSPDVFPLSDLPFVDADSPLAQLGLNRITGPCYFAVTMDAIALGRWYDFCAAEQKQQQQQQQVMENETQ